MAKPILSPQRHEQGIEVAESAPAGNPSSGYAAIYCESGHVNSKDNNGNILKTATVKQTGTGVGRAIHVQLSGEAAPSGLAIGDIVIEVT